MKFMWQGEEIGDIYLWAKSRNEPVVRVRMTQRSRPNPYTGLMTQSVVEEVDMPRCFYDSMRMDEFTDAVLIYEVSEA